MSAAEVSHRILVVEDEPAIREVMVGYLRKAAYEVDEAEDGETGLQLFRQSKPDAILLDLNLPKLDGIAICKLIRAESHVPIIMVTARTEEMDELIGLEIGADDYVKKPFSPAVLVARIHKLLERREPSVLKRGSLEIDQAKMEVRRAGHDIRLTTTPFRILYLLALHPGRVYTRSDILHQLYADPAGADVYDRTVDAHIKAIRKAIEPNPKHPQYVLTKIGGGYAFAESAP